MSKHALIAPSRFHPTHWPPREPWDSDALNHDLARDEHCGALFDEFLLLPDPPASRFVLDTLENT